ncbi:MAG TPA: polysaccharide biosynthesis/export family protein [Gemmataceae bacterium]|nr:polysaccharide biosynthesis/export family protein [Gemmataceae bacterium]
MPNARPSLVTTSPARRRGQRLLALLAAWLLTGCAALTNPTVDGVPVDQLPPELLGESREAKKPIPLTLLQQCPPDAYRLAPGDVLGIWIEGVLGEANVTIPVQSVPFAAVRELRRVPPAAGYPIQVREDGTISLPFVEPIFVQGLTIAEAQETIRRAYLAPKQILKPGRERILVSLLLPRQYRVVVMREESASSATGPEGFLSVSKRGTGHDIDLPAYENDVLHALAQTGGLPGLDAYDEVIIYRAGPPREPGLPAPATPAGPVVRIPLRWYPDKPLPFQPHDVVLYDGDVVFLEARVNDVYFTGGLLPAGEHVLPRDVDLDVVEAISRVRGPLVNGAFAVSNLSGALLQPGIGNPTPSLLTVLRKVPGGGQVMIRVDLNKALRDPRERIRVLPGDVLILQETPGEALARYFSQTFFNFNLAWQVIHERFITGVIDIATPDRLPGRLTTRILQIP